MTIREAQDNFMEELNLFDSWQDKFNLLIEKGNFQPVELPEDLYEHRVGYCQSRTHFKAENEGGCIQISGWSNSSIMAGLIVCVKQMFDCMPVDELAVAVVDFHTHSGLMDHVTPLRNAAIHEIVRRILVLCPAGKERDI